MSRYGTLSPLPRRRRTVLTCIAVELRARDPTKTAAPLQQARSRSGSSMRMTPSRCWTRRARSRRARVRIPSARCRAERFEAAHRSPTSFSIAIRSRATRTAWSFSCRCSVPLGSSTLIFAPAAQDARVPERDPFGQVPVIEDGDVTLADSNTTFSSTSRCATTIPALVPARHARGRARPAVAVGCGGAACNGSRDRALSKVFGRGSTTGGRLGRGAALRGDGAGARWQASRPAQRPRSPSRDVHLHGARAGRRRDARAAPQPRAARAHRVTALVVPMPRSTPGYVRGYARSSPSA